MVLIYTHLITPRVTYAMEVVFKDVLQHEYQLTSDLEFYQAMEVLEAMPMLTEFGEVIDQIKKDEKGEEAP